MVRIDEQNIIEKGRLGPGQMLAVDLREGKLYHDGEIKDYLAAQKPFGDWIVNVTSIDDLLRPDHGEPVRWEGEALRRSEEHTSELQTLMRISYAVFCLKKKNRDYTFTTTT